MTLSGTKRKVTRKAAAKKPAAKKAAAKKPAAKRPAKRSARSGLYVSPVVPIPGAPTRPPVKK